MKKLGDLEQALLQRQIELSGDNKLSPDKHNYVKRTLKNLMLQFQEFKEQHEQVEDSVRNLSTDISCRDLESKEPVARLIKDIEKLKQQDQSIKNLKFELEKIQLEIVAQSSLLQSMDTEKKLRYLLSDIQNDA